MEDAPRIARHCAAQLARDCIPPRAPIPEATGALFACAPEMGHLDWGYAVWPHCAGGGPLVGPSQCGPLLCAPLWFVRAALCGLAACLVSRIGPPI